MGAVGGAIRAFSGPPKVSTVSSTKNTALQGSIDSSIGGLGNLNDSVNSSLQDYFQKYMAGEGAANQRSGQEIGSIDRYYNGGVQNDLAQMRATRQKAVNSAADLAAGNALRSQNLSRVGDQGGGSSYAQRLAITSTAPIRAQAALDNANQERSDYDYLQGNQINLAGRRTAMASANAGYGLHPYSRELGLLGSTAGYAGQLGELDRGNKFYGLQQAPNKWADFADAADQGILNAVSIGTSVAGSMGGMKRGGMVKGKGTETSDSIPVRLSKNEYVLPAEVVHMTGVLPLLERIRTIALKHRQERLDYAHHIHGGPAPEKKKGKSGGMKRGGEVQGYSDGGLAQAANFLGQRAGADLNPTWDLGGGFETGNRTAGVTNPGGGGGGGARRQPAGVGMQQSQYFQPENYQALTPEWKAYGNAEAERYNNPASPFYIKPGTYE